VTGAQLSSEPRWHRYAVYGLSLRSNLALDELNSRETSGPFHLEFQFQAATDQSSSHDWIHTWMPPGATEGQTPWLQMARHAGGYLLRFPGRADFTVSCDGRQIDCRPVAPVHLASIRHLLLDQVLPLALSLDGRMVLHAAGVITPQGKAIAFAAESGAGKSTLATGLIRSGCSLLTDDGLLITEQEGLPFVTPSYPGVRLWSDSTGELFANSPVTAEYADYTSKRRLGIGSNAISFQDESKELKVLYFLGKPSTQSQVQFHQLSQREAFMELVKFTFALDVKDSERLKSSFAQFERLSTFPIFFRIDYPRRWEELPAVVAAALEHASQR
jgi:hypothetical protein